jgi:hypothetical protein
VTSLDSIEAPVRWGRKNLVDGYYYGIHSDPRTQEAVVRLNGEREKLIHSVCSPELRKRLSKYRVDSQRIHKTISSLPPQQVVYCGCIHTGKGTFVGTGGDGGKPREVRLLARGNVQTPAELVSPGSVPIIPGLDWQFDLPRFTDGSSGR